jgi:nucleoside-diphosphate-sugar epimerase
MDRKIVVVAGATGQLGGLIARALIKAEGIAVRALVRPGGAAKAAELAKLGIEVVEVSIDGSGDPATLAKVMQGAFSVVSALQGGPDIIVGAQSRLLEAAVAANVRRFIPSDYSVDFTRLHEGANRNFDYRLAFHKAADEIIRRTGSRIEFTSIFQGAFTELLATGWMLLNYKKRQVQFFGSPDTRMDFTTWSDTADFTAAAAIDSNATPRRLNIAGERLTPKDLQQVTKRATGVDFELKRVMSIGMLRTMISLIRFFRPGKGEPMPIWVGMQYAYSMALGLGSVDRLDNDRYKGIAWTPVDDTVRQAFQAQTTG